MDGAVAGSVLASHALDHLQGQGPDSAVAPARLAAYRSVGVRFAGMACVAHIRSEGVARNNRRQGFVGRMPLRVKDEKREHRPRRVSSVPPSGTPMSSTVSRSPRGRCRGRCRHRWAIATARSWCAPRPGVRGFAERRWRFGTACRSPMLSLDSDNAIAYPNPATVPRKRMKRERRTGKSQAATALATVGGESCAESTGPTGREGAAGRLSRESGDLPWHNATAGEVPGRSCATAHSARRGGSGRGHLLHLSGP